MAEFEYSFDNGDTVWGGRVSEALVATVDWERGEWREPVPLHGKWDGLRRLQQELNPEHEAEGKRSSRHGRSMARAGSASGEVELATLDPGVCDTV